MQRSMVSGALILGLALSLCPRLAQAQGPADALAAPQIRPYFASDRPDVPEPTPTVDRVLLAAAGSSLGLLASVAGGALLSPTLMLPGYLGPMIVTAAIPIATLLTVPAGVFLFGNLGGRGTDFGWTLLGGVLGALPGAALIAIGYPVDEGNRMDPAWFYAGGAVLAGVGLIAGSILAFELSSRPGAVVVGAGPGSLHIQGEFE